MNFDKKTLIKNLYEIKDYAHKISKAIKETLEDRGVIGWIIGGVIVYGIPALYRYITRNPFLPYIPEIKLSNPYIPSNLPEKLIVNSVAPGGVGAVIGETLVNKINEEETRGSKKYLSRVGGSAAITFTWTGIQYFFHTLCDILKYEWPSGGNPFESPNVYPFNLLIALTLAPLTPYVVDYLKPYLSRGVDYLKSKLKRNNRDDLDER